MSHIVNALSRVVGNSCDKKCVDSSAGFTVASDQHDAGVEDTSAGKFAKNNS